MTNKYTTKYGYIDKPTRNTTRYKLKAKTQMHQTGHWDAVQYQQCAEIMTLDMTNKTRRCRSTLPSIVDDTDLKYWEPHVECVANDSGAANKNKE